MKRREWFKNLLAFLPFTAAFAWITAYGFKFITPKKRSFTRRIFIMHLDRLPLNASRKIRDLRGKDLVLVRRGREEVKAMSTVCTHLGCTVHWEEDKQVFYCPCHGGTFDKNGNVIAGPPPAPLPTYNTEIQGNNIFIYFKAKES